MPKHTFPISTSRQQLLSARAQDMRLYPPEAERRLWEVLRARRLGGVELRRQVVVGQRIVDFLAPAVRLVVEVDGLIHARRRRSDERRDRDLARLGYHVLRIEAAVVMRNLPAAVALVREALERLAR